MNPKTKKILLWVCIVPLVALFAMTSFGKLSGATEAKTNFIRWGYNYTFMYFIGGLEGLAAIGLLISSLRKWAAIGLILIMTGAAYTHLTHAEPSNVIMNLSVSLVAIGVIRFSKK
jgi:putative oxidoreductase